ncbi:putative glycosyltransferase EpsE [Botrimarina colliarenosi]|uniref:Putative glycosyltransferase EpsE n=1 Tax=Botrimarina colliarenosi TaxID=2528001 RepID=A0A5C6AL94_9BACT|nr:glycosyltransferase [Botrimarina colliarenosi]TWU00029.1 putative glycosyltransferase EpsE [Botrimarina colliarenosi]
MPRPNATPHPAASFVLPVYNGERYLRETLASLRWQTFANWEAVCVNDGSTDGSLAILRDFAAADPRFRIIDQPNAGIVAALNRGLAEARAEWIARIDADDVALPHRLATQLDFVGRHPEVALVGSAVTTMDPTGDLLRTLPCPTEHEAIESALLAGAAPIAHPTVLMRRDAVLAAGGYRADYEWVEDADLWLRLALTGRLANLAEPLLRYRLHPGSVCWNRRTEQSQRMTQLLLEARAERGLAPLSRREPSQRKLSDPRGKWARQAARNGNLATAWRLWRELATAEPLSPTTWRCGAEALVRGALAIASGRRDVPCPTPDWREWDCPHDTPAPQVTPAPSQAA